MPTQRLAYVGWFLFTVSGLFFLVDAIATGDKTALGSAITWLLGVAFFVWALTVDDEG